MLKGTGELQWVSPQAVKLKVSPQPLMFERPPQSTKRIKRPKHNSVQRPGPSLPTHSF